MVSQRVLALHLGWAIHLTDIDFTGFLSTTG